MPVISSLTLTNQSPIIAYTASVTTSGSNVIADGLGNQLTSLLLTSSFAKYLNATSSAPPSNTSTVVGWMTVTVTGSVYKVPLYQ